jgi:hypothetical protein
MKMKLVLAVCLLALAGGIGVSCIGAGNVAPPELSVINKQLTTNASGNSTLLVTVKNTGRTIAQLAEVKVSFYDAQKNLLDSSRDSILNLAVGETWDFHFAFAGESRQIASYDVAVTSGTGSTP